MGVQASRARPGMARQAGGPWSARRGGPPDDVACGGVLEVLELLADPDRCRLGVVQGPGPRGQPGQVGAAPPLEGGQGSRVAEWSAVAHHRLQEGVVAGRRGLVAQREDIAVRAAVYLLGSMFSSYRSVSSPPGTMRLPGTAASHGYRWARS
jgi:hypothetical protein